MAVNVDKYNKQIKDLVKRHSEIKRNGELLFAGWYDINNEKGDVNLFEIYEEFPDPGIGKLETFMFPSSREFPIKGSLRLTVTSPSELREAAERNDPILDQIMGSKDKEVIYPEDRDWNEIIESIIN